MADSAKEILKTTKKGIKKNSANHKEGIEITEYLPQRIFFNELNRVLTVS